MNKNNNEIRISHGRFDPDKLSKKYGDPIRFLFNPFLLYKYHTKDNEINVLSVSEGYLEVLPAGYNTILLIEGKNSIVNDLEKILETSLEVPKKEVNNSIAGTFGFLNFELKNLKETRGMFFYEAEEYSPEWLYNLRKGKDYYDYRKYDLYNQDEEEFLEELEECFSIVSEEEFEGDLEIVLELGEDDEEPVFLDIAA